MGGHWDNISTFLTFKRVNNSKDQAACVYRPQKFSNYLSFVKVSKDVMLLWVITARCRAFQKTATWRFCHFSGDSNGIEVNQIFFFPQTKRLLLATIKYDMLISTCRWR